MHEGEGRRESNRPAGVLGQITEKHCLVVSFLFFCSGFLPAVLLCCCLPAARLRRTMCCGLRTALVALLFFPTLSVSSSSCSRPALHLSRLRPHTNKQHGQRLQSAPPPEATPPTPHGCCPPSSSLVTRCPVFRLVFLGYIRPTARRRGLAQVPPILRASWALHKQVLDCVAGRRLWQGMMQPAA